MSIKRFVGLVLLAGLLIGGIQAIRKECDSIETDLAIASGHRNWRGIPYYGCTACHTPGLTDLACRSEKVEWQWRHPGYMPLRFTSLEEIDRPQLHSHQWPPEKWSDLERWSVRRNLQDAQYLW